MTNKYKIGWQKYEDLLDQQMSNPLYITILSKIMQSVNNIESDDAELLEQSYEEEEQDVSEHFSIPISKQLFEDVNLLSNFDCWIGHTNFDITTQTKNTLDSIPGIEVLKIFSRYRFFIGVAKMFDFKDVRKNIEKNIIPKGA